MKNKKVDAGRVWKQVEDDVVPQLKLSVIDRAVYSYLLRHSHLEGRPRVRFTVAWLANGTRLCTGATRHSLHRLFDKGALRLVRKIGSRGTCAIARGDSRGARGQNCTPRPNRPRCEAGGDGLRGKPGTAAIYSRPRRRPVFLLPAED